MPENIYAFANSGMRTEASDTTFAGGLVTTCQLNEDSKVFYELRHSKPIEDHGSILRVYSRTNGRLSIVVKSRLLRSPSLKSSIEITEEMERLLKELSERIGTFKWVSEPHHLGRPKNLKTQRY
ncbi:MAG: hypothetical protein AAF600_20915 [Bacteroidota bacterium]